MNEYLELLYFVICMVGVVCLAGVLTAFSYLIEHCIKAHKENKKVTRE